MDFNDQTAKKLEAASDALVKRARRSSTRVMSVELPKDRTILPDGFPLSTLKAYADFNDTSNYPEKQPLFEELIAWLSLCDGNNVDAAVNKMFSQTLTDEVSSQLTWSTPPKNTNIVVIKDDKFVAACYSAVTMIANERGFGATVNVTHRAMKIAVQKALASSKARWRKLKSNSQAENEGEGEEEEEENEGDGEEQEEFR